MFQHALCWPLIVFECVSAAAGPHDFAIYGVVLPCVVGAVAAILLIVLIVACVCYYQKNKVVVIPVS